MLDSWKTSYYKPRQCIKKQGHNFSDKGIYSQKPMFFPVVMYTCENWTIKKVECQRNDVFKLWCWRRLLRVPWIARRSNQSILKEVNPEYCFPDSSVGKESACNAEDSGSIPGLGISPGEGKGYPLQYSGLESSMDCLVHGVAKSQTWLSDFHFHFIFIHWKDWSWSWSSSTLATWCEEPAPWKRPWCWERLRARGEGSNRK